MKKYIFPINLLAILLLISSCEDIVDADYKIKKTKINYNTVIADQENDVIMPLKIGNVWVYRITDYDFDGNIDDISYDSILVKKDTIINGEKWYVLVQPMHGYSHSTYMTNTNTGLFFTRTDYEKESYIRAEYPVKHSTYYVANQPLNEIYGDPGTAYNDTIDVWTDVESLNNYSFNYGKFNCYKYSTWWEARKQNISYKPFEIEYYVPNLGIIKYEEYRHEDNNIMKISTTAELIFTNVGNQTQLDFYSIIFGDLNVGDSKTVSNSEILKNKSNNNITIYSITITPNENFTCLNIPSLPAIVAPNETYNLDINFSSNLPGSWNSVMEINTNQGTISVYLSGISH